jgi:hypothetical protein
MLIPLWQFSLFLSTTGCAKRFRFIRPLEDFLTRDWAVRIGKVAARLIFGTAAVLTNTFRHGRVFA